MRLYKKHYNMRQICNIAVYMLHSACIIHLLNVPEKTAKRDIIHGVKHLEEIAEDWLCARRTLSIISVLARKWNCELPEEAAAVLRHTDEKYGYLGTQDVPSPNRPTVQIPRPSSPPCPQSPAQGQLNQVNRRPATAALDVGQEVPNNLSPDMLSSLGPVTTSIQQPPVPKAVTSHPSSSANPPFDASWATPDVSAPTIPRYHQAYAPVPTSTGGASVQSSRAAIPIYAIDGQDWFLKDGINWQQNFEGWGHSGSPSNSSGKGGSAGSMGGSEVFMFNGLQGNALDMGDGWDFDSSITNMDLLPGLDL